MASRKVRHTEKNYFLDVDPFGTPKFELMNEGITAMPKSNNPNNVSTHYIAEEQPRSSLENYEVSWAVNREFFVGDPVGDYLNELDFTEAVGDDAMSTLVETEGYNPENTPTAVRAKRRPVSIAIDGNNVEGGNALTGDTTMSSSGEKEIGMWNPSTKIFTAA